MYLYLVQHGEAKREEEDPQRGLTEKGFQDVTKVCSYLKRIGIKASKVFHSGKLRAMQTARAIAETIEAKLVETDGLAPMDDPLIWVERIKGIDEDIFLVGHLPHLSRLASLLLSGDRERGVIDFKMAGVVCLKRFEGGNFSVEWMVIPEIIGE